MNKLKTFPTPVKTLCVKGKEVIIQPDRSLFARLPVIREKTGISIIEQLRHLLGIFAWSLCLVTCNTRSMHLQVSAVKVAECNRRIETVDEIPCKSAIIYDGTCILHQVPKCLETFRDLSSYLLKMITSNDSDHVFFCKASTGRIQSKAAKETEEQIQDLFA